MALSNYLVRWVVTYLKGLTTYLYRGYNLFTKFHGHPSTGGTLLTHNVYQQIPRGATTTPTLCCVSRTATTPHLLAKSIKPPTYPSCL